jgi:lipopolysaccharide export system permease protein
MQEVPPPVFYLESCGKNIENNINQTMALCIFVKTRQLKKLDWLIIRTFIGPFILTFFIAIFVLVMQFLWKHIEDLASKGLGFVVVCKLLFYASASLVPMALPIAVLLSSIMTLGTTAENLELVAARASGVGLTRSIRPIFLVSVIISLIAFLFSNNVLPVANYRLKSIISEIARKMPAIDIQEGSYYDGLKGFTLRVDKKEDDQKTFYGLVVYDHTQNTGGAENIIRASKGDINVSDDGNYMFLNLFNGVRYSDMNFYTRKQAGYPFSREFFKEQHIIIDISDLNKDNKNNNYIGNQYTMMTIGQLNLIKGEIKEDIKKSGTTFINGLSRYYAFIPAKNFQANNNQPMELYGQTGVIPGNISNVVPLVTRDTAIKYRTVNEVNWGAGFLTTYSPQEKANIKSEAHKQVLSLKGTLDQQINTIKSKRSNLVRNRIEFHKKFTMAIACILFFLIGAPLGAIIRKGGLGLPLIFSIVIFILYYMVSTIFEKSVRNASLGLEGIWFSSLILLPFGLFLTLKASSDSSLFNLSTYTKFIKNIFGKRSAT